MKGKSYRGIYLLLGGLALLALLVAFFDSPDPEAPDTPQTPAATPEIVALDHGLFALARILAHQDKLRLETEYIYLDGLYGPGKPNTSEAAGEVGRLLADLDNLRLGPGEISDLTGPARETLEKNIISSVFSVDQGRALYTKALALTALSRPPFFDYQTGGLEAAVKLSPQETAYLQSRGETISASYASAAEAAGLSVDRENSGEKFSALVKALANPDPALRHRELTGLENFFGPGPSYWQARAAAALEAGAKPDDIALGLKNLENIEPGALQDDLYASLLMMDLAVNNHSTDETRARLKEITSAGSGRPVKRLFSALLLMRMGLYGDAADYLEANLGQGFLPVASRVIWGESLSLKKDRPNLWKLVERSLADPQVSNQEKLHYLGKVSDPFSLQKIMPAIDGFKLIMDSELYGQDTMVLAVPRGWKLDAFSESTSVLEINGRRLSAAGFGLSEDGEFVNIIFDKVFAGLEQPSDGPSLSFELATAYFPVTIKGQPPKEVASAWGEPLPIVPVQPSGPSAQAMIADAMEGLGLEVRKPAVNHFESYEPEQMPPSEEENDRFKVLVISTPNACWQVDNGHLQPCGS